MLGSALGGLALGAVAANAIMIPDVASNSDLAVPGLAASTQSIKLSCPDCHLNPDLATESADEASDDLWVKGGPNSLFLQFTLAEDRRSLSLNGLTLFPPSNTLGKTTVEQVPSDASLEDIDAHTVHDLVSISADSVFISEEGITPEGDAAIHLTYQVIDIDNHAVNVPGARVNMLKSASGDLEILSIEEAVALTQNVDVTPPEQPGGVTVVDCHGLPLFVCKVKAAIASKVKAIKAGCHGMAHRLPTHKKPVEQQDEAPAVKVDVIADQPPRPHAHHFGGLPTPARFDLHSLLRAALMVLIPIMAGFTIGMTVSVIGMLVGRLIAALWARYVRKETSYVSLGRDEEAYGADTKKALLADEMDDEPLPLYEDAPAYEETATPVNDNNH